MLDYISFYPRCRDEKRVQWVHALTDLWHQLKAYISANYPAGLIWGSGGSAPVAPPPPPPGGAPPPPPCPESSENSVSPKRISDPITFRISNFLFCPDEYKELGGSVDAAKGHALMVIGEHPAGSRMPVPCLRVSAGEFFSFDAGDVAGQFFYDKFLEITILSDMVRITRWVISSRSPKKLTDESHQGCELENLEKKGTTESDLQNETTRAGAGKPAGPDTKALFAEINRGDALMKGLRKVTSDMKTHKNPELRAGGVVSSGAKKTTPPAIPARPEQRKAVVQPKVEQIGNKWNVKHFVGNREVIVEAKEKKETVYIFECRDSVVQIKGKVNSIVLDSCKKTFLLFDTVISSVDVINCQSVQVEVKGIMPTINIDQTDGCQVYLSEESKGVDIITAKSSEMNILIPKGDGDYTEYNVPEQFKTNFVANRLETRVNDLSSHGS
ncbi:hypothetical protein ACTXT7_013485 [Hymenolepis weldensis]